MTRRRRGAVAVLLGLALGWLLVGCTSTVRPPEGTVGDPVAVLLAVDARHRGLLLPRGDGGYVEYGYGEYAWYAEMRDAWYRAFPAVLWPTTGTLGRRELAADDAAAVRATLAWMELETLVVERARATALVQELDARFAAGGEPVRNRVYGLDFVPDPAGYWCLFNCNDAVAGWLEQLGCRVSWVPIRVDLTVAR